MLWITALLADALALAGCSERYFRDGTAFDLLARAAAAELVGAGRRGPFV